LALPFWARKKITKDFWELKNYKSLWTSKETTKTVWMLRKLTINLLSKLDFFGIILLLLKSKKEG
jgi:hypothetical protein